MNKIKKISILGSTGSIGRSVLDVVRRYPDRFQVVALAAGTNIALLARQVDEFSPKLVSVKHRHDVQALKKMLHSHFPEIDSGINGVTQVAVVEEAQTVVSAIEGSAGLIPTVAALDAGKEIALANKETLVVAGEIVMKKAAAQGVGIIPIDSEHSAVFQCLENRDKSSIRRILLTASGGPFLRLDKEKFPQVTNKEALAHPTWKMGPKITIDSATLMNKGLEVIEAKWLFDIQVENIEVIIHPQSVVHSMVEYSDGSVMAQMGIADMRIPILYALTYPDRWDLELPRLDLPGQGSLTFEQPDTERFPCLNLAYQAVRTGGTLPAVMNGANEVAVKSFLDGEIKFSFIPELIEKTMRAHAVSSLDSLESVLRADRWARDKARGLIRDRTNNQV